MGEDLGGIGEGKIMLKIYCIRKCFFYFQLKIHFIRCIMHKLTGAIVTYPGAASS